MTVRDREAETMLSALAANAERANRPTAVVVFCVAALGAALIFAGWSFSAARGATRAFNRSIEEHRNVEQLASLLERLRSEQEQAQDRPDAYAPETRLLSTISQAAPRAGIDRTPQITGSQETVAGSPLVRQIVAAQIDRQPVEAVTEWITIALRDIPGLHIVSLTMRPTINGWQFQIRFGRWEYSET